MQSLSGSTVPTHGRSNVTCDVSKIALWHNPDCDDETSRDSDDDDDTSNDLNDNDDETDLPIIFWLQDPVRYLIAVEAESASAWTETLSSPFPTYNDGSVVSPAAFSSYGQTIRLVGAGVSSRTVCVRLGDLSFGDTASLFDTNCYFMYGMLARLQPYSRSGLRKRSCVNARADENVVCSQRPKRRPVHL